MSTDESYIHPFDCKLYHNYHSMVITTNIEHIMLIAYIVNAVEVFLDISITRPMGFLHYL